MKLSSLAAYWRWHMAMCSGKYPAQARRADANLRGESWEDQCEYGVDPYDEQDDEAGQPVKQKGEE